MVTVSQTLGHQIRRILRAYGPIQGHLQRARHLLRPRERRQERLVPPLFLRGRGMLKTGEKDGIVGARPYGGHRRSHGRGHIRFDAIALSWR